jgi:hypothetical protein
MNMSSLMDRIRGLVSRGGGRSMDAPAPTAGATTPSAPRHEPSMQEPAVDEMQRPAPGPGQETPPQGS